MDNDFYFILDNIENETVFNAFVKAKEKLSEYERISVSVSGGADSDVMLDMLSKIDTDHKIKYIWFDTGLEYKATKQHLEYLENEYDITIERHKAIKPIPLCVKQYGLPFLSKRVSQYIQGLQHNNFKWEDKPYEELLKEYPKCKSYLDWWCNKGTFNAYNVNGFAYLKEFLIANPPDFPISNNCCKYSKKMVGDKYDKENNIQVRCIGLRKAEGGNRSGLNSCFFKHDNKSDFFYPILWFTNQDKEYYENHFSVEHSDCYKVWGFKRTGCTGCPFNKNVIEDLEIIKKYEPNMYTACMNIFGKSYEYTKKYRDFVKMMKGK